MAKTLTQVGIETGNLVEAYHVTQSIDAFTGVDAYDISLSGSLNITGSLSQGSGTQASGIFSHAEGQSTQAIGDVSHAEGASTTTIGEYSHAEGGSTIASGSYSHAEGVDTIATGNKSHAEGEGTTATGIASHAEGYSSISTGESSHAEGIGTTAQGDYSHAEGESTVAQGGYSHAEGNSTTASGHSSHAEGQETQAIGYASHAEGYNTVASGSYQHVQGQFNLSSSAQSAFIVGNGTSDASRSNLVFASGSQFQVTGSVIATTGFTGSLQGTASFAVTASHVISASYAVTASHVNLLAGPNITINKVGTTFEISGSGGGGGITPAETGSFYISSSVNLNTITFHQGDGTTESVTVNTGSLSIPSSISQFGGVNIVTITNNYSIPTSGSYRIFNNKTIGAAPNIDLPTTSSVGDIIEIIEMPGSARTFIQQNGTLGAGQQIRGFGYNTTRGTTGALVTRSGSLGSIDTNAYLKLICINPGTAASTGQEWKFVEYSSEFWYNQFTNNGGVPFDINEIVSFI